MGRNNKRWQKGGLKRRKFKKEPEGQGHRQKAKKVEPISPAVASNMILTPSPAHLTLLQQSAYEHLES